MIYLFRNSRGEIREVSQGANDDHVYYGENGTENDWKRVYTVPGVAIDSKLDPWSARQFIESTGKKKGTMGDLWDKSKELSEARKKERGVDPIKAKFANTQPEAIKQSILR